MPTLVVKNLPAELYARLKAQAARNGRSATKEAAALIERGLAPVRVVPKLAPPIKLKRGALSIDELEASIAIGRE